MHRESQDFSMTSWVCFGIRSLFCSSCSIIAYQISHFPATGLPNPFRYSMSRSVQEYAWGRGGGVLFLTGLGKGVLSVMTELCQWSWCMREFTNWISSDKLDELYSAAYLLVCSPSVLQSCCNLFWRRLFFFWLYVLKTDVILHSGTAAIALCTLCPSAVWQSIR